MSNNFFGSFGGRYVSELLRPVLEEVDTAFHEAMGDPGFIEEYQRLQKTYIGRPTPLLYAENATKVLGGAQIYIKMEGLANTGAHKINNAMGQALLAKRMGKTRIIAETGAGQHGLATAAVCAKLGIECHIFMGEVDIRRQHPNVFQMEMFGAEVIPVKSGSKTLKDAVNEAMRDWADTYENTYYLFGSALGPAPYPEMVRTFQSVIGKEVKEQGKDIDVAAMIACVGGGSNAIGFFEPFIKEKQPRLIGVEAGGIDMKPGNHASRMTGDCKTGIIQGYKSFFLMDEDGQLMNTHSVSAGLDYPGIGPELAFLGEKGRIEFTSATDQEALDALAFFAHQEGVIFALESAHAGAEAIKMAKTIPSTKAIIINMSGRGDKDLFITAGKFQPKKWASFLKKELEFYED